MKIADAHCDTLTKFTDNPFYAKDAHWNLDKFTAVNGILQYMAVFTPPAYSGDSALRFAVASLGNYIKTKPDVVNTLLTKNDFDPEKVNVLLCLEGGTPVIDDINNLYALHGLGIRLMTLTWNHRNYIADGVDNPYGLTVFGKELIKELNKLGIIIDVSHLNEAGFDDLLKISDVPFAATHSNCFSIREHPRNLKDEQIKEIIARKGFIGMNFYSEFLGDKDDDNTVLINKFLKHVEHVLELGGEDVLGLGADYDGINRTPFPDVMSYRDIEGLLINDLKLSEVQTNNILHSNLVDFTKKMLK